MFKLGIKKIEFSNFGFQIRPVTGQDFPVTAVTRNPDHPREFFLRVTKT